MQIFIKTLTGSVIPIEANGALKIEQVKHLIHQIDETYRPDEFNLSFSGSPMDESRTLTDYNVRHESTIYIVSGHVHRSSRLLPYRFPSSYIFPKNHGLGNVHLRF